MGRFQSASLFLNGYAAALLNTPRPAVVPPAVTLASAKNVTHTHAATLVQEEPPTQHETCCCWWEIFPNQWRDVETL